MKKLLPLLLLSCATLDSATMKEPCAVAYNACLNRCPSADSRSRRPEEPQTGPESRTDTLRPLMIDVASCTQGCNDEAKECQRQQAVPR